MDKKEIVLIKFLNGDSVTYRWEDVKSISHQDDCLYLSFNDGSWICYPKVHIKLFTRREEDKE